MRLHSALATLAAALLLGNACSKNASDSKPLETKPVPAAPAAAASAAGAVPTPAAPADDAPAAGHNALPAGHPPMDGAAADVAVGTFAALDKNITDLRTHRSELNGQTLSVRGRVTKVNRGIMDHNWLHLRDPSGDGELIITTKADANKGDLVVVKGKVAIDRDLGAGYRYDVLIEDAEVRIEATSAPLPGAPTPAAGTPTPPAGGPMPLPPGHPAMPSQAPAPGAPALPPGHPATGGNP